MSIHDLRPANPVRLVVVQQQVSPADDNSCALGAKRCHQMEGAHGGWVCPVFFHRKLDHSFNPFRVARLDLCSRGEELAK